MVGLPRGISFSVRCALSCPVCAIARKIVRHGARYSAAETTGGFKHIQHVPPNGVPHKKGVPQIKGCQTAFSGLWGFFMACCVLENAGLSYRDGKRETISYEMTKLGYKKSKTEIVHQTSANRHRPWKIINTMSPV